MLGVFGRIISNIKSDGSKAKNNKNKPKTSLSKD